MNIPLQGPSLLFIILPVRTQVVDNNFDDSHVIMLIKTLQALLFTEMETMDQWRSLSSCLASLSYPISYPMLYPMSYMISDASFLPAGAPE